MDSCKKCSQKFSYWQVYQNYWSAKQQIECSNCKLPHAFTIRSRALSIALVIVVPSILQAALQTEKSAAVFGFWTLLLLYIVISLIMSFLTNPLLKVKPIKQ